ncbi:DUF2732 domain-containing protein [Yersinia ruckeri]|uniref:DUF2732 domain-containing protein n=1 Tax=Yersinia ruckeri TaxID=29486 RepID=UPI002237BE06|nr:DUF2732 domain-containing protein [Yersinia ruckeri]MCW6623677.1 DUF2732 domain-containing protein [Yersinia ruckeri]
MRNNRTELNIAYSDRLNNMRMDERKNQAIITSVHLENLANVIVARSLNVKEAVQLLREESEKIQNQSHECANNGY